MINTVFSKNLRKLREEKHISQKSAAENLGISQALLSHYEKGIRECGLDFLIRAAKFYEVSTDFMLGISNDNGKCDNICKNKIKDDELKKDGKEYNIYAVLYKNLLINAISYIFGGMRDIEYKDISIMAGKYISLSIYCLYNMFDKVPNNENLYLYINAV